ncbi:hypothetical protein KXQ82_07195 [Mucilaginibacter sp. HMF5004]|uniref:hypothetical protein n=1 Tax=Mucilaginibacter rivuli TaxID=2857527 RepID=UPI001C5DA05E|nr:hypothetical protein [Mucilaginibacter rivuli]MBW4889493.1 hypothetical protein [Mucilaginibacter rivuli]
MSTQNHIVEIPSLFSNQISRRLVFDTEGMTIEKPFGFDAIAYIAAEDFASVRMGIKRPRLLRFINGKQYVIEIKLYDESIIKIKLNSICNLRVQNYEDAWADMIRHLYTCYFSSQLNLYMELFHLKQSFTIGGVDFYYNGICWDKQNIIQWNEVALSNYQSYFVVHHRQDVSLNRIFNFLNVWNAHILQAMIKYAVEDHQRMLSE